MSRVVEGVVPGRDGGFVIEQAIRKRERKKVSIKSELERIDGRDGVEVDKGG